MGKLWTKNTENEFFRKALEFSSVEQLFYKTEKGRYVAYWPKGYKGKKSTIQSRNSLIGNFTEKWTVDLLNEYARSKDLFAVQGVVCENIGLTKRSPADVAICKTKDIEQKSKNIIALFEVKMSVVWNWEYKEGKINCLGDYMTHQGNPGLLRSDSMLKAIGKSINIRVSSYEANRIPIVILGNTPITKSYFSKVDHLKSSGIIQGFWSVNSSPRDNKKTIKKTTDNGFYRFDEYNKLLEFLDSLVSKKREFFSSMISKQKLGQIIEVSNNETGYVAKAEKFLQLIKNGTN